MGGRDERCGELHVVRKAREGIEDGENLEGDSKWGKVDDACGGEAGKEGRRGYQVMEI